MTPSTFPEANTAFKAPSDSSESQCCTIEAFGGSCDGVPMVITAWRPSPEELSELNRGGLVYLTVLGGLPPHFVTTSFDQARRPA